MCSLIDEGQDIAPPVIDVANRECTGHDFAGLVVSVNGIDGVHICVGGVKSL